jgi:hypothetical protein
MSGSTVIAGPGVTIARQRREINALRDRVARLEEALGLTAAVPADFCCGSTKNRRQSWRLVCALAMRGVLDASQAMVVLYPDRTPAERPGPERLKTHVTRVRSYFLRHDIVLAARPGAGWMLDHDMQAKAQALVARLMQRAAA